MTSDCLTLARRCRLSKRSRLDARSTAATLRPVRATQKRNYRSSGEQAVKDGNKIAEENGKKLERMVAAIEDIKDEGFPAVLA